MGSEREVLGFISRTGFLSVLQGWVTSLNSALPSMAWISVLEMHHQSVAKRFFLEAEAMSSFSVDPLKVEGGDMDHDWMDGWISEWMRWLDDEWMDGWVDGFLGRCIDE